MSTSSHHLFPAVADPDAGTDTPDVAPDATRETLAARDAVAGLLARRRARGLLGGVGASVLLAGPLLAAPGRAGPGGSGGGGRGGASGAGSGSGSGNSSSSGSASGAGSSSSGSTTTTTGSCTTVAQETAGPFPADGSNTNNGTVVDEVNASLVRANITTDVGGTTALAGIPLTLAITVQNKNGSCAALAGVYVYIWHCSKDGNYSGYSGSMNGGDFSKNSFLRGVQKTDASGKVAFTSLYPGRYSGRCTHIHAAVFPASAYPNFDASTKLATTQFCFPDATNTQAYTDSRYATSANSGVKTNSQDGIFSDGTSTELLTVTGSPTAGYAASITIAVGA